MNFTLHIKKVMWLCTIGWDNLTNQRTDLASQHLKCCFGHSEMPEQILSSKKVCIHDCIPKQQKSTPENNDHIYCVLSARSEVQVIHKWKWLIKWLLLGRKDGRCIYIALYCVSLHTQSASQSSGGGSFLNHHQCAASTGQRRQCAHHTPTLYEKCHGIFNDHRESEPRFNISSEIQYFLTVVSPSLHWGVRTHTDHRVSTPSWSHKHLF